MTGSWWNRLDDNWFWSRVISFKVLSWPEWFRVHKYSCFVTSIASYITKTCTASAITNVCSRKQFFHSQENWQKHAKNWTGSAVTATTIGWTYPPPETRACPSVFVNDITCFCNVLVCGFLEFHQAVCVTAHKGSWVKKYPISISLETRWSKHFTRDLTMAVKMGIMTLFPVLKRITEDTNAGCFDWLIFWLHGPGE